MQDFSPRSTASCCQPAAVVRFQRSSRSNRLRQRRSSIPTSSTHSSGCANSIELLRDVLRISLQWRFSSRSTTRLPPPKQVPSGLPLVPQLALPDALLRCGHLAQQDATGCLKWFTERLSKQQLRTVRTVCCRERRQQQTDRLSKQQTACVPFRSEPLSFEPETKTPPLTMIYPILPPHPAWAPWEVIGRLQSNDISLLLGPALQL